MPTLQSFFCTYTCRQTLQLLIILYVKKKKHTHLYIIIKYLCKYIRVFLAVIIFFIYLLVGTR